MLSSARLLQPVCFAGQDRLALSLVWPRILVHGNLRYVKSQWIGLAAALVLVSPAQAEAMTPFDFLPGVLVDVSG